MVLSERISRGLCGQVGTELYMAPEQLQGKVRWSEGGLAPQATGPGAASDDHARNVVTKPSKELT